MSEPAEPQNSVDAIRCLYLALEVERRGHAEAAQRWRSLAQRWLNNWQNTAEKADETSVPGVV